MTEDDVLSFYCALGLAGLEETDEDSIIARIVGSMLLDKAITIDFDTDWGKALIQIAEDNEQAYKNWRKQFD